MQIRLGLAAVSCAAALILPLSRAARSQDAPPGPPRYDVPKAELPIVVDGVLFEPVWQQAPVVRVDYLDKQPGVAQDPPHMTLRVVWDDQYLYLGYVVFDRNLQAEGSGDAKGPPGHERVECVADPGKTPDFVEFFLSFGDPNFFWEIHHNAANNFTDIWCVVTDPSWPLDKSSMHLWGIVFCREEYIRDDGPYTVATAVCMTRGEKRQVSTVNHPEDTDIGYSAEIRLPWRGIGTPRPLATTVRPNPTDPYWTIPGPWKMADQSINILAVTHDGDSGEMYFHSSPTRKGDWFHRSYAHWPVYTFRTPP